MKKNLISRKIYNFVERIFKITIVMCILVLLDIFVPKYFYQDLVNAPIFRISLYMYIFGTAVSVLVSLKSIKKDLYFINK